MLPAVHCDDVHVPEHVVVSVVSNVVPLHAVDVDVDLLQVTSHTLLLHTSGDVHDPPLHVHDVPLSLGGDPVHPSGSLQDLAYETVPVFVPHSGGEAQHEFLVYVYVPFTQSSAQPILHTLLLHTSGDVHDPPLHVHDVPLSLGGDPVHPSGSLQDLAYETVPVFVPHSGGEAQHEFLVYVYVPFTQSSAQHEGWFG